ncbi:MAG TPA: hypothetical protein VEQ10_00835 [Vicinamibacteria bacterium]|nr:hypothetical protein [Vicinamibacteria bacterium]
MRKTACGLAFIALLVLGCHTITEELPTSASSPKPARAVLTIPIPAGLAPTPTPAPTPKPTPTPSTDPTPDPTPTPNAGKCGNPVPMKPIARFNVKVNIPGANFSTLDSTPIVGPDKDYCRKVGYTDGRLFCPVRAEGNPERSACEEYVVGHAKDTGRQGPTWYRNGQLCDGVNCSNVDDNQYLLYAITSGHYEACSEDDICGSVDVER